MRSRAGTGSGPSLSWALSSGQAMAGCGRSSAAYQRWARPREKGDGGGSVQQRRESPGRAPAEPEAGSRRSRVPARPVRIAEGPPRRSGLPRGSKCLTRARSRFRRPSSEPESTMEAGQFTGAEAILEAARAERDRNGLAATAQDSGRSLRDRRTNPGDANVDHRVVAIHRLARGFAPKACRGKMRLRYPWAQSARCWETATTTEPGSVARAWRPEPATWTSRSSCSKTASSSGRTILSCGVPGSSWPRRQVTMLRDGGPSSICRRVGLRRSRWPEPARGSSRGRVTSSPSEPSSRPWPKRTRGTRPHLTGSRRLPRKSVKYRKRPEFARAGLRLRRRKSATNTCSGMTRSTATPPSWHALPEYWVEVWRPGAGLSLRRRASGATGVVATASGPCQPQDHFAHGRNPGGPDSRRAVRRLRTGTPHRPIAGSSGIVPRYVDEAKSAGLEFVHDNGASS